MLTRLKIKGFKNLVDVDVRFGPFTCVAGPNGAGKSNLFDAILFISALADVPFIDAARSVRDEKGRGYDIRGLFHRVGDRYDDEVSFEAEMIVPSQGADDLGQEVKAKISFLRYSVTLAYQPGDSDSALGTLQLVEESLDRIIQREAKEHLLFDKSPAWLKSALRGRRTSPFISTEGEGPNRVIKLHQDGKQGRTLSRLAASLPRTVLSNATTAETPTVLLARREMQSWKLLHLEPSSLRKPDDFLAPKKLGADGSHLAATIYRLGRSSKSNGKLNEVDTSQVYGQIANRLAELIHDVSQISIDRDERRELVTVQVTDLDGTTHPAQALSDGTLRFLALATLELDPEAKGLLCLEEPENGIAPDRLPAMLRLLQDIATDVYLPIGEDNPLRQVIINTHSPAVVAQVPDDSLLVAEKKERVVSGKRFKAVTFSCLPETWRASKNGQLTSVVPKGKLLAYLSPIPPPNQEPESNGRFEDPSGLRHAQQRTRRVIDRPDIQPLLPYFSIQDVSDDEQISNHAHKVVRRRLSRIVRDGD